VQALRRELATGEHPLPETFKAILQCFAKTGLGARVDEILAILEREGHDALGPWQWVVGEMIILLSFRPKIMHNVCTS
jgi:hypothetical protein